MKFKELATVSGKPGLYKVLKPTRSGVILEALDEKKSKLVVGASQRVSILSEISIYTTTEEGAIALEDVMKKIEKEFKGDLGVDGTADADELKAFLKHVLPEFDEDRVYASDIKKLITWYQIIRKQVPESLEEVVAEEGADANVESSEDSKEA
ncbi:hypothetical protein P872_22480 [Rhodonellum psychrophilum GCM71 = DSM 17998]|uniref:Uncharacterized protein n=2 Tax=Rhodonellum TaxID=336827 RepID=U5BW37_9BACT|nr:MULTISPECIES: DUF5606 domain-containing protein [Rhodonellum]ERM84830.1 hypothetical protein P872_22480 [Rhodonellum psychrophilum GCM71 = DSM 17998]MDO9552087.1 DUF5606 domain-containing protein [Rhodonellum sp.]SDY71230.1 hypothetical protein SAMN05444412_102332 [Rhodonellum ikkaensis]